MMVEIGRKTADEEQRLRNGGLYPDPGFFNAGRICDREQRLFS